MAECTKELIYSGFLSRALFYEVNFTGVTMILVTRVLRVIGAPKFHAIDNKWHSL